MKVEAPEGYYFSNQVQGQLDRLRDWDGPDFRAKLVTVDPLHDDWLSSEVLVLGLRQVVKTDGALARWIVEVLLERWGRFILKAAWRYFPATKADLEAMAHNADFLGPAGAANAWHSSGKHAEMLQEVYTRLWEQIKNPRYKFWVINFFFKLERLCLDVGTSMRGKDRVLAQTMDPEGDEFFAEFVDPSFSGEAAVASRDAVVRALASLPRNVATAIYLRHIGGWRVSGTGSATGLTICDVLHTSDRTVRNYLRAGEKALRQYYLETGQL